MNTGREGQVQFSGESTPFVSVTARAMAEAQGRVACPPGDRDERGSLQAQRERASISTSVEQKVIKMSTIKEVDEYRPIQTIGPHALLLISTTSTRA